jgi:hypothetical protein
MPYRHIRTGAVPPLVLLLMAAGARADTAVRPGLWETTEKVTLDGNDLPVRPRSVCLKANEASIERLLMLSEEEAKARGCKSEETQPSSGSVRMTMSCPASDSEPAIDAAAEVRYTPTSFEGTGTVKMTAKDGQTHSGTSALSGKRRGDCP